MTLACGAGAASVILRCLRAGMAVLCLGLGLGLCSAFSVPALAHESLPIVISLEEPVAGEFTLGLRMPGNVDVGQRPWLALGRPCIVIVRGAATTAYRCPQGFRPAAIAVDWPGGIPSAALLVRAQFANGEQHSRIMAPGTRSLALPRAQTPWGVVASYVAIGAEHILLGFDHLLFLICLVLVAGTARRIVLTVSGFTLGHALTISLASLGWVHVDSRLVEALIALSIVFVATELARGSRDTLLMRYPVLIAAGFGTLHGLGFAGALADVGLAQTAVAFSLVGFNLGVEAGQLIFVLMVISVMAVVRHATRQHGAQALPRLHLATVAGIGIVSAYWFWQRALALAA